MITVSTATEDELSEEVARQLIQQYVPDGRIGLTLLKGGSGYLRSNFDKFCAMAKREHILLLTDLDRLPCAPKLVETWTDKRGLPTKLLFRVSVREIESWLLADRAGLGGLLGISEARFPASPDDLADPKQALLTLARAAKRDIRHDLVRVSGSQPFQGIGYNRVLCDFVNTKWNIAEAAARSPSLNRTVKRLSELR